MKVENSGKKVLERKAEIYKAVGHPIRLSILRCFITQKAMKLTVKSIYEELGITQPVTSHHLGILKSAGVLIRLQERKRTFYSIREEDPCVQSIQNSLIK